MSTLLRVANISKSFNVRWQRLRLLQYLVTKNKVHIKTVLKDVSFDIAEGEIVAMTGRNGGGKTTLLRVVAGILEPDTGSSESSVPVIPFISPGAVFHRDLTLRQNIQQMVALLGLQEERVLGREEDILSASGVEEDVDEYIRHISPGSLVRLALSVLLEGGEGVFLFDEVSANLDVSFQEHIVRQLKEKVRNSRSAVLLVSHQRDFVAEIADRVIVLEDGSIIDR